MVTIGILGAAGIAVNAAIRPVRRRDDVEIGAVASRSGPSAYADEWSIPRARGTYEPTGSTVAEFDRSRWS